MSIDDLSKKQVSKLLNGHPVRVKMGSGGKIHISAEQAKKMNRAGLKGCAITLTLDPYAIQHNQHLRDAVGMLRKLGVLKGAGTKLIDQPFTVRQAVNSTGDFFKDPAGTLGFGTTKGAVLRRAKRCCKGKGIPEMLLLNAAMGHGFEGPLPSPDNGRVPAIPNAYRGRGRPSMKGDGFWEDVGSIAKKAGKTAVKALANEVVQYAGPAAALAFESAAKASGNPDYAPAAKRLGQELGSQAGRYVNKRIQGMGRKKCKGGTLLIDEPITTRQVVNTTGNFFKNPARTLGFGAKKPKRVMSEAQKAALAKGRHALRIKLNEMGAGSKSGMALQPAGY